MFENYDKPAELPTIRHYLSHRAKIIFISRQVNAKGFGKNVKVGAMTSKVSWVQSASDLRTFSTPVTKTRLSELIGFIKFCHCLAGESSRFES